MEKISPDAAVIISVSENSRELEKLIRSKNVTAVQNKYTLSKKLF